MTSTDGEPDPTELWQALAQQLETNNETLAGLNAILARVSDQLGIEADNRERSIEALRQALDRKNESAAALRKSIRTLHKVIAIVVVVVLAVAGAVVLEARHASDARDELAASTQQKAAQLVAAARAKAHDDCVRSNAVRSDILAGFDVVFGFAAPTTPDQAQRLMELRAKLGTSLAPRNCPAA